MEKNEIKTNEYTVETWITFWLMNIKINLKGNTRDSYYSAFKNHIIPILGKIKLQELKLLQIQSAVNKVMNTNVIHNGKVQKIKGKTVREIFSTLKQALQYAIDENLMPYINFKRLELPKVKKGTRNIRSEKESKIISNYFANKIIGKPFDLYYAPIAVMEARGLRPEECGGLCWEDIDFENDFFWVGRHTVVKNGIYDKNGIKIGEHIVVEDSAKTPHGERKIPLENYLSSLFKAKYIDNIKKGINSKPNDFIFITKVGTLFYEQSLRQMYKSSARKLEITEMGCYSLRHEFATYLSQIENCNQETIIQLMGWKNIIDTYFHTNEKHKRQILNDLDNKYKKSKVIFFIKLFYNLFKNKI